MIIKVDDQNHVIKDIKEYIGKETEEAKSKIKIKILNTKVKKIQAQNKDDTKNKDAVEEVIENKTKTIITKPKLGKKRKEYTKSLKRTVLNIWKGENLSPTHTVNKDAVEDDIKNKSKTQITKHKLNEKERGNNRQAFEKECIDFDDLNFGWILKTNVISAIDP